jgi:hypothetical protein
MKTANVFGLLIAVSFALPVHAGSSVRGIEDLQSGPITKKYFCDREFATKDASGAINHYKSTAYKVEKLSQLPGGRILKQLEYVENGGRQTGRMELSQVLGEDGWITESGEVYVDGEAQPMAMKEVFRFDGNKRITKSFEIKPAPRGMDVRENHDVTVEQISETELKQIDKLVKPYQVPFYVDGVEAGMETVIQNDESCVVRLSK